jgi:hypothetical protein
MNVPLHLCGQAIAAASREARRALARAWVRRERRTGGHALGRATGGPDPCGGACKVGAYAWVAGMQYNRAQPHISTKTGLHRAASLMTFL